jgi:hypothetical protein
MRIYGGPNMNARDAADEFARTAFGEPRKVGKWRDIGYRTNGPHLFGEFQLVHGIKWYSVLLDCPVWVVEEKVLAHA